MRCRLPLAAILAVITPLGGATLEKLTLDDMIQKSTAIVRGKMQSCSGEVRGPVIYTHCQVTVSDRWKGSAGSVVDVRIPGGTANGLTQKFSGSPVLNSTDEYVFFLWTGKSGITQIIGLSQGLLTIRTDSKGDHQAKRDKITENIVNSGGAPVQDHGIQISVSDLKSRVLKVAAGQ